MMFKRRWVKVVGGLLILALVAFFVVARAALPGIAGKILTNVLGVPVSVEAVAITFPSLDLDARGVRIGQPEGFGDEPMIEVKHLELKSWKGLRSPDFSFGLIRLEGLELLLVSNKDHVFNMAAFIDTIGADSEEVPEEESEDMGDTRLLFERIELRQARVIHRDESVEGEPFELVLESAELDIDRLAVGSYPDLDPGLAELSGELVQEGQVNSPIYLLGRFGAFDENDVRLNSALRLSGARFETFFPLIPSNTGVALGGKGFDLDADFDLLGAKFNLDGSLRASNGSKYSFRVHLDDVEEGVVFELPKKLSAVTNRMAGGAGRLVRSAFSGSGQLITGTIETAEIVGKGAVSAVGSFIKGVGKTAAGAVHGDGEKMGSGIKSATAGTGEDLFGTVGGSIKSIGDTGGDTFDSMTDDPTFDSWLEKAASRHESRAEDLKATLLSGPFPPSL